MAVHLTCDGVKRRDVLKVGIAGAAGMTLANYLQLADARELATAKAQSAIFINLQGGPSHLETFDLKPQAPLNSVAPFNPCQAMCLVLRLVSICQNYLNVLISTPFFVV